MLFGPHFRRGGAAALTLSVGLLLAGCDRPPGQGAARDGPGGARLEQAAVEAGLIPAPGAAALAGRYERVSELGTDRFCAVPTGSGGGHRIGVLAVFGPDSRCEAVGSAQAEGDRVAITLRGREDCRFDARFDGTMIAIPGRLPPGCASYCTPRASLAGVSFTLAEAGAEAARRSPGRDIERLCGDSAEQP